MDINGKFDPDCRCRQYKNTATGKNLCMKASQHIVIPSSLKNNLAGTGQALKAADVLTGASADHTRLNTRALNKAANQSKRYAEKLLRQYNQLAPSRQVPPIPVSPTFVKRAVNKLVNAKMKKRFGSGRVTAPLLSGTGNASPALSQAIKAIRNKKNASSSPMYQKKTGGQFLGKKKEQNASTLPWPSRSPTPGRGGTTLRLENTTPLHHKAKNADIHTNAGIRIWKVISNRYLISGIPQLFKEDKKE